MITEPIRAGQVWRYRDEREDRQIVIDSDDHPQAAANPVLDVHNERTGRRSRIRESVLRKTYRLVPPASSTGSTATTSSEGPTMTAPDAQTHREQLARAAEVVVDAQDGSPSIVQRKLYVTYARADSLLEELERYKVVAARQGTRSRRVLVAPHELAEVLDQIRGVA